LNAGGADANSAVNDRQNDEARQQRRQANINAFVTAVRGSVAVIEDLERCREVMTLAKEFLERRGLLDDFQHFVNERRAPAADDTEPAEVIELGPAGNNAATPDVQAS